MGTNEPPLVILVWHSILDVFEIVIGRKIEFVGGRYVVVHKLRAILNYTKALVRVVLLARLDVDKVLLDVLSLQVQLLLLLQFLLVKLIVSVHSGFRFAQLFK